MNQEAYRKATMMGNIKNLDSKEGEGSVEKLYGSVIDEIERRVNELPVDAKVLCLNRILRLFTWEDNKPVKGDVDQVKDEENPNTQFQVDLNFNNIVHIRAEWDKAGIIAFLKGKWLAAGLITDEAIGEVTYDDRFAFYHKGEEAALSQVISGIKDDEDMFFPILVLPHSRLFEGLQEKTWSHIDNEAQEAEKRFRVNVYRKLYLVMHQLLEESLTKNPTRKLFSLLEKMVSPDLSNFPLQVKQGGRHNIKVADQPEHIKEALGLEYVRLQEELKNIKRDAKSYHGKNPNKWRDHFLLDYRHFDNHDDLLNEIGAWFCELPDEKMSEKVKAPWEIRIELAARKTIPDYKPNSVSPGILVNHAILPKEDIK